MQDISFKGLTADLRRSILSEQQILDSIAKHPQSRGFVGNLPNEWIKKIPREKRKEVIPKIYDTFSFALKEKKGYFGRKKITQYIREVLEENKIISPHEKIKFSYLGSGDFANLYKLTIGKTSLVTKIFRNDAPKVKRSFGNLFEQNNALYLNAKKDSDWVKFYFGNLKDGYMVTKYISYKDKKPKNNIDLKKKGLEYIDYRLSNYINGVNVDYGGIVALDGFPINDKTARRTIRILNRLPIAKQDEYIKTLNLGNTQEDLSKKIGIDYVINHREKLPPQNMGFFKEFLYYFNKMYSTE